MLLSYMYDSESTDLFIAGVGSSGDPPLKRVFLLPFKWEDKVLTFVQVHFCSTWIPILLPLWAIDGLG